MSTSSKALHEQLKLLAAAQQGFFTTRQAIQTGYADSVHGYHVRNGDWIKVHRGIYRLADASLSPWPELVIWHLWSLGRGDPAEFGVYCRETALAIHGQSTDKGTFLHMTVPSTFRRNVEPPPQLILHKEDLAPDEIEMRDGYAVTTLARTLADLGGSREVDLLGSVHEPAESPPIIDSWDDPSEWAPYGATALRTRDEFEAAINRGED